jgi:hypothetical protein
MTHEFADAQLALGAMIVLSFRIRGSTRASIASVKEINPE